MSLDGVFRKSFYSNLIAGWCCLGYVMALTQPVFAAVGTVCLSVIFAIAYLTEDRWALNARWSNVLALVVGFGAVAYFLNQFAILAGITHDGSTWLTRLMPHLSLWLAILTAVKLLRPKLAADRWAIYLMTLLAVGLACMLENDAALGLLLFGYLFTSAWSLALFYLQREHVRSTRLGVVWRTVTPQTDAAVAPRVPWRLAGVPLAVRTMLLLTFAAFALFLMTPRQLGASFEEALLKGTMMQTWLGDSQIDLNRTGTVRLTGETAFEVKAEDANGRPKYDLLPTQRWRWNILNYYRRGRWSYERPADDKSDRPTTTDSDEARLPDLGSESCFFSFVLTGRLRWQFVVAEPVVQLPGKPPPVIFSTSREFGRTIAATRNNVGELRYPTGRQRGDYPYYRQVTAPLAEPDLGLPVVVDGQLRRTYLQMPPLDTEPSLATLRPTTVAVLQRLVARGELTAEDIRYDAVGLLMPAKNESVARALSSYLAHSGDYSYSLELKRSNRDIDPTLDFLLNVKQGHCERFASALALMLRSLGVPARVVVGYRGADHQEDGRYVIRNSDAHSWVEALVQRTAADGTVSTHWLSLDPTASDERNAGTLSALGRWWKDFRSRSTAIWQNYIVDFNARQQDALWQTLGSLVQYEGLVYRWTAVTLAIVLPLAIGGFSIHRYRRQRRRPGHTPETLFYGHWLRIVARRCSWQPREDQTPQEFAATVADRLAGDDATVDWAGLARAIAGLYYRVRFGGQPLTAAESSDVATRLQAFDRALAGGMRKVANPVAGG